MLSTRSAALAAQFTRLLVLPALLLAPASALAATRNDPAPTPPVSDAPATFNRPFFAGVYLGDDGSRTERIDGSLSEYTRLVGKRPALLKTFRTLGEDFSPNGWVGSLMRKVDAAGSTNYVALDLRYAGSPRHNLLDAINSGAADNQIRGMARQMRALRFKVLVSPGWEMNGRWNNYAWQGHANGGAKGGPAKYAAAFRRMVDIFRREGASNVKWVFSPNVGNAFTLASTGASHWNWYANYYPGDRYVDYLGPHGYNGSSLWGGAYQNFDAMFNGNGSDQLLTDMEKRYPGKPIIIGEYATEELRGQDKGQWIARAYETMRRHPNVVGAIWFNMKKETDWRINSSGSALQAYRTAMADPNVRSEFR
jgi:endoglucanase